jgi:hypothetical protein
MASHNPPGPRRGCPSSKRKAETLVLLEKHVKITHISSDQHGNEVKSTHKLAISSQPGASPATAAEHLVAEGSNLGESDGALPRHYNHQIGEESKKRRHPTSVCYDSEFKPVQQLMLLFLPRMTHSWHGFPTRMNT